MSCQALWTTQLCHLLNTTSALAGIRPLLHTLKLTYGTIPTNTKSSTLSRGGPSTLQLPHAQPLPLDTHNHTLHAATELRRGQAIHQP